MRLAKLTLLLVAIATVAGCVPQQQYNQEVQQNQQLLYLNGTYQQLNQSLQSEVATNQVQIKQLQNRLVVTMVNSILFPEGGWELHKQGRQQLTKVLPALQGLSGKQIVIQGFTDNLPIEYPLKERFPTNWDLAAGRAVAVVRFFEEQGLDPNQLSAVSFGRYHPVASNDTPEGRAQNRRINIEIQDQMP
jgi:chemotaxis protein MotB